MSEPLLYDLCCKAGGATRGYQLAGFRVIGIDKDPQPRYIGDGFIQMDALEFMRRYLAGEYERAAAFAGSPPCQRYSEMTAKKYRGNHPAMIEPIREMFIKTGLPYVIENVEGARFLLVNPIMLCGSMFGLQVWRHRFFETNFAINALLPPCNHGFEPVLITGTTRRKPENGGRFEYSAEECRSASGLYWMTRAEMDEAIPPAYTEFIGRQIMGVLCTTA